MVDDADTCDNANIAQVYYDRTPQPSWYDLFFDRNRVTSKTASDGLVQPVLRPQPRDQQDGQRRDGK